MKRPRPARRIDLSLVRTYPDLMLDVFREHIRAHLAKGDPSLDVGFDSDQPSDSILQKFWRLEAVSAFYNIKSCFELLDQEARLKFVSHHQHIVCSALQRFLAFAHKETISGRTVSKRILEKFTADVQSFYVRVIELTEKGPSGVYMYFWRHVRQFQQTHADCGDLLSSLAGLFDKVEDVVRRFEQSRQAPARRKPRSKKNKLLKKIFKKQRAQKSPAMPESQPPSPTPAKASEECCICRQPVDLARDQAYFGLRVCDLNFRDLVATQLFGVSRSATVFTRSLES